MPLTTTAEWPDLIAGKKAKASEVELKFDWMEGCLFPQYNGNLTTSVYDIGSSSYKWREGHFSSYLSCLNVILDGQTMTSYQIPRVNIQTWARMVYHSITGFKFSSGYLINTGTAMATGIYRAYYTVNLNSLGCAHVGKISPVGFTGVNTMTNQYIEIVNYNLSGTLADPADGTGFYISIMATVP